MRCIAGLSFFVCALIGFIPSITSAADPRDDILIADFEGADYGTWKTTGDAFGTGPARGTLPGQMPVEGFEGKGLVNSFLKGDGTTGTLTSPEFPLARRYLSFLIGGGKHPGKTCINLLVKGEIVQTASGPNDLPGGSERLEWQSWDVARWDGQKAQLQIVDHETGGWGHVNIDQILQTDRRRGSTPIQREFVVERDYLHLPVKNGAAKRQVKFLVDGQTVREFEIELADVDSDFLVFVDVRAFKGRKLTVAAQLPFDSKVLERITAADTIPTPGEVYTEVHRPQFHFTSRRGWLNDPNGLVYFAGEWHLFYQHNPYGWSWGNMHWGHAVSRDLFHWQELPTALFPKAWGDFAFSGSAIVDHRNDAGFQNGAEPALLAFFTSTGRGECLAYSNDRGRTWHEYAGNPVVKHSGRDPKVVWHEPSKSWIMAVYDERPDAERGIAFYFSKNLKDWFYTSRITGFYECPDLFPIKVVSEEKISKWVLYGADGKYLVGNFDGKEFQPEFDKPQPLWYGNFYAAQSYSDAPDDRRVQIGWGNGVAFPGMPFNQQMCVPVELSIRPTADGDRMFAWPVREIAGLAKGAPTGSAESHTVKQELSLTAGEQALDLFDLTIEIAPQQARQFVLSLQGTPITYDVEMQTLKCRHVTAPVKVIDGKVRLRVLGDRNSLEIFANNGAVVMSVAGQPSAQDRTAKVATVGGEISVNKFQIQALKSAWTKP